MKTTLEAGNFGWDYVLKNEDGHETYVQNDWEYPSIASLFGWVACPCGRTDGTIDCKHKKVSDMLFEAQEFLDSNLGQTIDLEDSYF